MGFDFYNTWTEPDSFRAQSGKQFIAVTCHFDVIDWLEVDWVYNTDSMEFFKKKRTHPQIELKVCRCNNALWKSFRQYHYLNGKLGVGVRCYTAVYNEKSLHSLQLHTSK